MRNRIFNISNIYLLLITLLQLQDVAYKGGTLLSKGIIASFVGISALIAIYTCFKYKLPKYLHALNALLVIFTLYGLIHMVSTETDYVWFTDNDLSSYSYLLNIYISLLPIYVFYLCSIKGQLSNDKIQRWIIILLVISIARFYIHFVTSTDIVGKDEITNNFGYLFIGIISTLVFFRDKLIIQYTLLAICMGMVILSMKRGAIFVASICLIPFVLQSIKQGNSKQHIVFSITFLAFIVVGIYFIQYMLNTSEYFITRINDTLEGNSSLRDSLYAGLWKYFINQDSIIEMFFGGGANKTIYIVGNYAHNDWLEILINQGIIGILIYFIYWITFWKTYKRCNNIQELSIAQNGILICFIASLLMSLFSMSYANLPIGLTMTLGICLGQYMFNINNIATTNE